MLAPTQTTYVGISAHIDGTDSSFVIGPASVFEEFEFAFGSTTFLLATKWPLLGTQLDCVGANSQNSMCNLSHG